MRDHQRGIISASLNYRGEKELRSKKHLDPFCSLGATILTLKLDARRAIER